MSITVDEDKLQVPHSKGTERKGKRKREQISGEVVLSYYTIHSEMIYTTVHRALAQSRIDQAY